MSVYMYSELKVCVLLRPTVTVTVAEFTCMYGSRCVHYREHDRDCDHSLPRAIYVYVKHA